MEPTGGYPIILTRQTTPARAPVPTPAAPAPPTTGNRRAAPSTVYGTAVPTPTGDEPVAEPEPRRRRWLLVVLAAIVLGALVAVLLVVHNRPDAGPVSLPLPPAVGTRPTPAPTVTATADASGSAAVPAGSTPSGAGSVSVAFPAGPSGASVDPSAVDTPVLTPAALRASYRTLGTTGVLGLTGYRGQVTITNTGQQDAVTWTVTLTLPGGEKIGTVTGAVAVQEGTTVTFLPTGDTGTVPAGDFVAFTFDVSGVLGGPPTGCAINDQRCD
jgi:hypothetical protein